MAESGREAGTAPEDASASVDSGPSEKDAGGDAHVWQFSTYHVFVTRQMRKPAEFRPQLSGIEAADAWCKTAGVDINQNARWVAYLATGTGAKDRPVDRLTNPPNGFYRYEPGGGSPMQVFADIKAPSAIPQVLIYDEGGKPIEADAGLDNVRVWIGSTQPSDRCNEWAGGPGTGIANCGNATLKSDHWNYYETLGCDFPARIYCFEQDP